jgi:hypothetical protein
MFVGLFTASADIIQDKLNQLGYSDYINIGFLDTRFNWFYQGDSNYGIFDTTYNFMNSIYRYNRTDKSLKMDGGSLFTNEYLNLAASLS